MKLKLVLLVLVVFLIGCDTEVADTPTKETEDTQAEVQEDKEAPGTRTTGIVYSMNTTEGVFSMNQSVNADYWIYEVTKAEIFTEMGTSMMDKETEGEFVKVYLKITNNAKETKEIVTPRFRLIDSQLRQFDRLSDDMFDIADYLELDKQLQPSLATSGAIVFEVPKDSRYLKLRIIGDWLSVSEIRVALSDEPGKIQ